MKAKRKGESKEILSTIIMAQRGGLRGSQLTHPHGTVMNAYYVCYLTKLVRLIAEALLTATQDLMPYHASETPPKWPHVSSVCHCLIGALASAHIRFKQVEFVRRGIKFVIIVDCDAHLSIVPTETR